MFFLKSLFQQVCFIVCRAVATNLGPLRKLQEPLNTLTLIRGEKKEHFSFCTFKGHIFIIDYFKLVPKLVFYEFEDFRLLPFKKNSRISHLLPSLENLT